MDKEALGPAERIIDTLLANSGHLTHNRPGVVYADESSVTGIRWHQAVCREQDGKKVVFKQVKGGKDVLVGTLWKDGTVRDENRRKICDFRYPGLDRNVGSLMPEAVAWAYRQVADVWKVDHEFAARWASFTYQDPEASKDLKVVLAAFMLVQSRKGDPVREDGREDGEVVFYDQDFREVGEAMCLHVRDDKRHLDAKLLLRVWRVLRLPEVAAINRELEFTRSARNPALGRWERVAQKWLRFREDNPQMLDGLVRSGQSNIVADLCRHSHYVPRSPKFFELLRWRQDQSKLGHRSLAIGAEVKGGESWDGLSEEEICGRIVRDRVGFKRIVGLLPKGTELSRAMVVAAVEAGSLSSKDLLILTPTLEKLGLLEVEEVRTAWDRARKEADDTRAANIAKRVRSEEVKDALDDAADGAVKKALEEDTRSIRTYFFVDRSQSMDGAIEAAKEHVAKFLQGFPEDKVHVAVFNTVGQEVRIPHASKKGVEHAFHGVSATGGTVYGQGVLSLSKHLPEPGEDVLFVFIGDEEERGTFTNIVRATGLNPMAFGLVRVLSQKWLREYPGQYGNGRIVQETARQLGIPCFMIDDGTFSDPYAISRTIRNLVASTPVGISPERPAPKRKTLVERILETELLRKPDWAA